MIAPELALTGYSVRDFGSLSEPLSGSSINELSGISSELDVAAGFGLVLSSDDRIYNAFIIVDGGERHVWVKQHRWWHGDHPFAIRPSFAVVEVRGIRIGAMICFDGRFPESARLLALAGADLIAWPCCWPGPPKSDPRYLDIIGRARSFENQCYVALANRYGFSEIENTAYAGGSALFDPLGEKIAFAGDEECILYADVDLEKLHEVRARFDIYSERKPELYGSIASQKAPCWFGEVR